MIWLNKIFLLMLVIELSACSQFKKIEAENVELESNGAEAEIISKPDKSLPKANSVGELAESKGDAAHRQSGFAFETITPLASTTLEILAQVCSPFASVPLGDLPMVVSDPYNPPPMGKDNRHQGTDFAYYRRYDRASLAGDVVQSIFEGRIAGVVEDKFPYGNAVIIETSYNLLTTEIQQSIGIEANQSIYTLYGHLDSISVQEISNDIRACQPIGIVGKTGNAGVEHLHLEMRIGVSGENVPSMGFYVPEVTPAEREAYKLWRTSGAFLHFDPMKILDTTP